MRCLTLAEALNARGHSVELMGDIVGVDWLEKHLASIGLVVHSCAAHSLDIERIQRIGPDWVVVDSYEIDADDISELNQLVPCLAIVDGDMRSIEAKLYLDQNLGAEDAPWVRHAAGRVLAGSNYCLVRDDIVKHRTVREPKATAEPPTVTVFLGGTDPEGTIVDVAKSLADSELGARLLLVCPPAFRHEVSEATRLLRDSTIVEPTVELPQLLSASDVVVSAAGTSAWDVCTLAIPSVFIATVENQQGSLRRALAASLALGIDAHAEGRQALDAVGSLVGRLLSDSDLRGQISARCRNLFDGMGKFRVVEALEDSPR